MIRLVCVNIAKITSEQYEFLYQQVSKKRQKKADRFYHFEDAKRCVMAEAILRAGYYIRYPGKEFPKIEQNQYGKPFFEDTDEEEFNISHSGDWVVVAFSDEPVGVDVELIAEQDDCLHQFVLTENEYKILCQSKDKNTKFTQYWGSKESFVKCIGKGLVISPDKIEVEKIKEQYRLTSVIFHDQYILSVCGTQGVGQIMELRVDDIIQCLEERMEKENDDYIYCVNY